MSVQIDISDFPHFRKLDIHRDKASYNAFYSQFPIFADFSFGNLVVWLDANNDLEVSRIDHSLVFHYTNAFRDNHPTLSVLGDDVSDATVGRLFDYQVSNDLEPRLAELPEPSVRHLNGAGHRLTEDRDSFEYLLDTKEHAELRGGTFSRLRRKVAFFKREHAESVIESRIIEELTPGRAEDLKALVEKWGYTALRSSCHANCERPVLARTLSHFNDLDMRLLLVTIDDQPLSFVTFQMLPQPGCVTVNHFKVDYSFKYSFDFTTHVLAVELLRSGVHTMNFEQDLGIPGLRAHKVRLRPVEMLKKYSLEPAEQP